MASTGSPEPKPHFQPRIIGFLCHWCSYECADALGRSRSTYPANLQIVRLMCSGRVAPQFIMKAFEKGADGVIVMGCPLGDCHYRSGNAQTLKRLTFLKTMLPHFGIAGERLQIAWVGANDTTDFIHHISTMANTLQALGPIGRKVVP
jgi:F420-non-reducing hydrogenase iron-sulfur subunit